MYKSLLLHIYRNIAADTSVEITASMLGFVADASDTVPAAGTPDISGAGPVGRVEPAPGPEPRPDPRPDPEAGGVVVPLVTGDGVTAPAGSGHSPRMAAMSSGRLIGIVLVPQLLYCAK